MGRECHNYTKEQKERMAAKLSAMASGQGFLLNKNDIENSLECKFKRGKSKCQVIAIDSDLVIATAPDEKSLVEKIILALKHWDDILILHQEYGARK